MMPPQSRGYEKEEPVSCWFLVTMGLFSGPVWFCAITASQDKSTWVWSLPITIIMGCIVIVMAGFYCVKRDTMEKQYATCCARCFRCDMPPKLTARQNALFVAGMPIYRSPGVVVDNISNEDYSVL